MASRFLVFVAIQGVLFQTTLSQVLNRIVPGYGPVVDGILPNQFLIREPGLPVVPGVPPAYPALLPGVPPVYPAAVPPCIPEALGYAPTIIQDSSVANSLANALQLLVVSNLLSTTLPGPCDAPYPVEVLGLPGLPGLPGVPGYNYIY